MTARCIAPNVPDARAAGEGKGQGKLLRNRNLVVCKPTPCCVRPVERVLKRRHSSACSSAGRRKFTEACWSGHMRGCDIAAIGEFCVDAGDGSCMLCGKHHRCKNGCKQQLL